MIYKDIKTPSTKVPLLLTLAGLILLAGCGTQEVQTYWSAEPVKVDGEITEWTSGSTVYFEDSGVQLGLRNDNQNLYILFRFNNQAWARAIHMGGVTLWLDNSGKKKKDFGIRYTGGAPLFGLQMPEASGEGGFREAMTLEQQQRLLDMTQDTAGQITIIDKKSDREITLRADDSGGPAFCFASLQGIYTYEFSIPLQKNDVFAYGIGVQPGQALSLGLEWGGMSKENRQKMRERMGGGGMGGGREGGSRGGPGMQASEKQELWVKTQLASPPAG